jgi:hypothetical protein
MATVTELLDNGCDALLQKGHGVIDCRELEVGVTRELKDLYPDLEGVSVCPTGVAPTACQASMVSARGASRTSDGASRTSV